MYTPHPAVTAALDAIKKLEEEMNSYRAELYQFKVLAEMQQKALDFAASQNPVLEATVYWEAVEKQRDQAERSTQRQETARVHMEVPK